MYLYLKTTLSFCILFVALGGSAFSDDALNSLQHDVVLAKEKYQSIAGKVNSLDLAFDREKSASVQQEADLLMQKLQTQPNAEPVIFAKDIKRPPAAERLPTFLQRQDAVRPKRVQSAIPAVDEESPLGQIDITPTAGQSLEDSARKKLWRWPKFDFLFPTKKSQQQKPPHSYMPEEKIGDGEALYKVAISDNKVSIQEAIEIGVANNLQLQATKKNAEVAEAKLTEAKRALFPTAQGVIELNGGKSPGISGARFYKGRTQQVNMTQPLYYGGELTNTVKQAEENLNAVKAEYKKTYNEFVHQVRLAYYGVVKAEYNAQYQLELFEKISRILKQVKEEEEQKIIAEIEVLNVESLYYQTLYQVESSKSDVLSSNIALRQSMNLDSEEMIPVELKLDFFKVKVEFNDLLSRALENNADIRIKVFGLEAAKYGIDIYESKKKPHFDLRGSYGMTGEEFHDTDAFADSQADPDTEKAWYLGVHGSMPLGPNSIEYEQIKHRYGPTTLALTGSEDWKHHIAFNLFDKFSAITDEKTAQYALLQAESDYQNVKNEVTLRLRDDYYGIQKYLIQIDSSIAKVRYQEKQNAILEYLLGLQEAQPSNYVENLIEQAQNKYAFIQAVTDYNTGLSSLGVTIGDPDFIENQRLLSTGRQEK